MLDVSQQWQSIFGGIFLCVVGIPHGANDHLYRQDMSRCGLIKFLAVYIVSMIGYLIVWWLIPALALILFFAISFHHFGQSNFESLSVYHWPSFLWGIWILVFPVLLHFHEAIGIFNEMISVSQFSNNSISGEHIPLLTISNWQLAISASLAMLYISSLLKYEQKKIHYYLLQFILVSVWYLLTPLLFGFITVFCLWHALQSLKHQAHYFQYSFKSTIGRFVKAMLPFSLISLIGFGIYIYFMDVKIAQSFILLSLISLPHIVVMHGLYHPHQAMSGTE